jgi:hypothetical protein
MSRAGPILGLVICILAVVVVAAIAFGLRPKYVAKPLLTGNEHEFYQRLTRANAGGHVFPQVAMSALIEAQASSRGRQRSAFGRIAQKRVDFVLCEGDLGMICVVELDDKTHDATRDRERDALLRSAGIETLRWQSRSKPSVDEIRSALSALSALRGERAARARA